VGKAGSDRSHRNGTARGHELAAVDAALHDKGAARFTVGQVAELLDVRPWFLRRLDSLGVVTPTRSGGDQRRYSRADIERLIDARSLMREGVSVAGIRHVFALRERVASLEAALEGGAEGAGEVATGGGQAERARSAGRTGRPRAAQRRSPDQPVVRAGKSTRGGETEGPN
jgi:DNA-binding transcriptional MerR regulator